MNDKNSDEIAKIIRLVGDLGKTADGKGDPINEAYLRGLAEGLALADLVNRDQVQMMTRWSQILVSQQFANGSIKPMPHPPSTPMVGPIRH
ncbi:hypothetical protein [Microvirga sp. VF16]|uniref:hypothetical protein n=1 Tax=Microvirga sp. VF16 TaxID=2807101 RepID=UPI00193CA0FB|nr:hypothetical protein [Microvirga sp. VF16]QRM34758.1 hypothetical protein JO965_41585 [Microvirga sp. VF16]